MMGEVKEEDYISAVGKISIRSRRTTSRATTQIDWLAAALIARIAFNELAGFIIIITERGVAFLFKK